MGAKESVGQEKDVNDAEYRLNEFVYILHQADTRCIASLLKKKRKEKNVKDESSTLH